MRVAFVVGALVLLSPIASSQASAQTVEVELRNSQGEKVGSATLTEQPAGVRISLQAWKLPPGSHGFHIHAVGECDPPGFTSAGGHFNPDGKKHGLKNPAGPHAGDLPNLAVRPDGSAIREEVASRVTLGQGMNSLLRRDGSSLMIHASPDDDMTDPTGNAGARIACGVISSSGFGTGPYGITPFGRWIVAGSISIATKVWSGGGSAYEGSGCFTSQGCIRLRPKS